MSHASYVRIDRRLGTCFTFMADHLRKTLWPTNGAGSPPLHATWMATAYTMVVKWLMAFSQ